MADTKQVFEAFAKIGRQLQTDVEMNKAAALGFFAGTRSVRAEVESADLKASAAYYPYAPPAASIEVEPPQPARERKRFLKITKAQDAFFTKVPVAAPENLLGKVGLRQIGEWRIEMAEDDRLLLLESFDEHQDAVDYASRTLATFVDDEHEYASVGEVPC